MAITAKESSNFTKMVAPFENNYIMVEVSFFSGQGKNIKEMRATRYVRIGDLTLKDTTTGENITVTDAKSFEKAVEKFRNKKAEMIFNDGQRTETVTAIPISLSAKGRGNVDYNGYFRRVPSYIIRDEAEVVPDLETKEKKAKYILKQRGYRAVKNDYLELEDSKGAKYVAVRDKNNKTTFVEQNDENAFKYIAVKVKGEDKIRFVEVSQIKYIDENGKLQQVGQNLRGLAFELARKSNDTFTPKDENGNPLKDSRPKEEFSIILEDGGQTLSLEEVYTDATYRLEQAKISEFIDGEVVEVDAIGGINLDSYTVRTLSVEKTEPSMSSPSGEDRIVVKDRPIDKFYVEQKSDTKVLKPNQKAYVNYECYQLDETGVGDYLRIRYKGDLADTMVALEFLFLDKTDKVSLKEKLEKEKKFNILDLIGRPLYVKPKDESLGLIETEPLTNEQAIFRYNERKFLYETTKDEDIASEGKGETAKAGEMTTGAYLLLKDGRFVKEADAVQPICYDFCQSQATKDFDAYLITIDEKTDHPKSFVVDKTNKAFDSLSDTIDILIPGAGRISVNKNYLKKIKKSTKGIYKCDIVQTSSKQSNNNIESCVVLRKPKDLDLGFNLPQETELDSIIKQLYDEFMQRYKAKQYEITEVLVPNKDTLKNEFIEFVQNHRYMYSSTVQMLDGATNTLSQYLNMKAGEFTFKADGSISGGPKYDAKRGMREGYSKLGTAALYALGFTFSGGGVLVSLASPFLLLAAPAVIGAAGLVIPLVQNVKKRRIEQNNYEFSNKSEAQNESVKQNAFERISKIVDELQVKYKNGKAECKTDKRDFCLSSDDEQVFLSALNAIEQELICGLSQNRNGGTFHMKDGKSIINGANAHEFSEYRKKINNLPDVIKDLESREQEINREIEKLKESKDKNKETKIKDAQNRLAKVLDDKRNTQTELEKAKAGENFIISGTNNETDPELEEILNRIENAKKFVRAKYFRKMNGEWIKDVGNNKGIVNLDELINKTLEAGEDKKEIRSALISFVMHTDITVDVKGKNFRFVNSHEKYSDDKNIDWKKVKEIAAKHGLFIDETLGMQTIEDKIETVNVAKPIPTTKKETEKETEVKKEAEKETENEAEKDKETEKETVKKPEKELKQRGLSALIKKFNTADFKQYFKLIELDNKSKRKGLVYREDAKKAILNHIKQYELYKGLLYKTIAELENKASLSEKQKEKLEKLRYFRDESEYLIKSFNNSYGSFSKDEEEKSL